VIATVRLPGITPYGAVVNSAGTRLYVAYYRLDSDPPIGGSVAEIDTQTNEMIRSIQTGPLAYGMAINPTGSRVYVSSFFFNTVTVIDARCGDKIATVSLFPTNGGGNSIGLSVTPDGQRLYAAVQNSQSVKVISTATNTVIGEIPTGVNPAAFGVFIAPNLAPPPPPVPSPAHVTGIEVTQAIQDLANSVPLVIGRRTFARVYVETDGPDMAGITATLSAIGAYGTIGGPVSVPLGPIVPSNTGGPRITVKAEPKRSIINDSFIFDLPWEWTAFEGLRLHAELSAPNAAAPASCQSDIVAEPVREFRTYTTLKVAFVRMGYKAYGVFNNPADAFVWASPLEQSQSESWMRRTYPVSELTTVPDFPLFDALLGQWVDRTSLFCLLAYGPNDISKCAWRYVSLRLASLQAATGFMGDADVAYGLIPRHPLDLINGTNTYFTRGACCADRAAGGPANDPDYAAHEIGHFLGRDHPVQAAGPSPNCGHSADDPNYPYFFTFIAPPLSDPETALAGFDGGDASLLIPIPQAFLPPLTSFDIMGYCQPTTWISDYTYKGLSTALKLLHPDIGVMGAGGVKQAASEAAQALPQMGDWLLVYGQVAPDLASAALISVQRVDRIYDEPPRPPGTLSIRLLDQGGGTLVDYFFTPVAAADATTSGAAPELSFGHVVPFVAGTRTVQIVDSAAANAVLATYPVSANAPLVENVAPQGLPDPDTGLLLVTWSASDFDNDALSYDLHYSRDDGASLQPLMLGVDVTSASIDASRLGGGSVRFRVVASDGLLTGFADSAPIVLPDKVPEPRILTPGDDAHVYLGQVVNLEGEATDPQDGVVAPEDLAWSSQQGPLGTGSRLSLASLPVGANVITLTATNSVGLSASRSINVLVDGDLTTPGPTLTAGPGQIGWQVAAGETQLQSGTIDIGNRGSGTLQFVATSGAPWLELSAPGGTASTTLGLSANPAGFAEGVSIDTTVTLSAVGFPQQQITIPVRLAVGNTFDVGNAPTPVLPNAIFHDGFE
jgi:YVTN family beta-propeller protein